MKNLTLGLAMLAALALSSTAASGSAIAADRDRAQRPVQIGVDDRFTVDPQRAYIFFRSRDRVPYRLLREVTEAERAEHAAHRAAALAQARTRYERRLRSWQRHQELCRGAVTGSCTRREERPEEPTDASFAFAAPEMDNFVDVGIRPRFTHLDGWSGYFLSVPAGTYSFYGQMLVAPNGGAVGTCLCMGSVRFEARPGQITYVGEVQAPPAPVQVAGDEERTPDTFRLGPALSVTPHNGTMPMPERFAGLNVAPAQLRAADKLPNYFGVMIGRMAPIEGVLDYRRDEVVDLRAAASASAGGQ